MITVEIYLTKDIANLIMEHWSGYLLSVIEPEPYVFIVIVKEWVDFQRFEGIFNSYCGVLVAQNSKTVFKVYNYNFSNDFRIATETISV